MGTASAIARLAALLAAALTLGGCVTMKPMSFDCADFANQRFVHPIPPTAVVEALQSDVSHPPKPSGGRLISDQQLKALEASGALAPMADELVSQSLIESSSTPNVLLLSGGGQWGAFGTGYLRELHRLKAYPRWTRVTGVSTGALQALFVGAAQGSDDPGAVLDVLWRRYRPAHEREIVRRGGELTAVVRGAVANLGPLRGLVEKALCDPNAPADKPCPMIEALARDAAPEVQVGFVQARSGDMYAANIKAIARQAVRRGGGAEAMKQAQQCIAAAAIASAAMPFYYQQVQVRAGTDKVLTMFDGGVRQSVFFVASEELADAAERQAFGLAEDAAPRPRHFYIVRNGPTNAKALENPADRPERDPKVGALGSIKRAYALMVNQSEVRSIEMVRLARPKDAVWVATADGYDENIGPDPTKPVPRCAKREEKAMFEPQFMACLEDFGATKANGYHGNANGWIVLPR